MLSAIAVGLLILIWGTTWAVIRVGLEGMPPFTGAALRFAIAAAVLLAAARWKRVPLGRRPGEIRLWAINGLLGFSISYGVVYWCEQWVPSALAAVLFATFPLFVALLAHATVRGEQLRPLSVAGVLIGFAGVALIYSDDLAALGGAQVASASVVFLLSPFVSAVASVYVKREGGGLHPLSLAGPPLALAALALAVPAVVLEHDASMRLDGPTVGALLYLSLFGTAATFWIYYWVLERVPVTRLALITYATPVVALAVGALALDERLTARTYLGAAVVLAGVALATRRSSGQR